MRRADGRSIRRRRIGRAVWLCALWLCGCGPVSRSQQEPARNARRPTPEATPLPGSINGMGWHIPWKAPDPKHPNGPPITVLIADSESGSITGQGNNIRVRLLGVHARLFHEGKASAEVQSDRIDADRGSHIVTATGHVRVTSLVDPPDTVVTSDQATWDTHATKIIATGHAHAVHEAHGNGVPVDSYGDRIVYDTATGILSSD